MKHPPRKHLRILAISPSARGFGFAVMEEPNALVDWGLKAVKGDKNARCLSGIADLIGRNKPTVIVLENAQTGGARRAARIQALAQAIIDLAKAEKVMVKLFSRQKVRQGLFPKGQGTKYAQAQLLAARFPEELAYRVPRKRRPWMSEDSRMDIFEAVALAQHLFSRD
jgi:Holliday junction resolvasome RuvABC endonuclease subunit